MPHTKIRRHLYHRTGSALNDRQLVELLYADTPALPFPRQYLKLFTREFSENNFSILDSRETFGTIRFWDVGALIWFARVIEWEFPDFSVKNNLEQLRKLQDLLEQEGIIEAQTHRFLFIARKPHP